MAGKGDKDRISNYKKYWDNFDNISKKEITRKSKKLKGNIKRYIYK